MNSIFVRQNCCVLNNFSYTTFRWGSRDDSEQRQRQLSIKPGLVQNTCWLSYTMQRCYSLGLHCEKTSRTSTARFRTMHQKHWSCHWEATLWREITSRQSFRTHKRPLSVTRCLLPATTLVNDNSDDKPRRLPLYVNSLSSCLSYEPRGIASVTVNGISRSSESLTIVYAATKSADVLLLKARTTDEALNMYTAVLEAHPIG